MLAGFANMGALYQHNPYETVSGDWNTYPWVLGRDNRFYLSVESELQSKKTRWDGLGSTHDEDSQGVASANNLSVGMTATLIRFDMWGNIGSDTDNNDPSPIGDEWLADTLSAPITNIETEQTFLPNYFDSNSESDGETAVITSAPITNIETEQTFFPNYFDSNSESDGETAVITSAPITNIATS
jgi:hypothetical protein